MKKTSHIPQAYLIGGGLGNLASAVYLIRDGGWKGENIHIIESLPILGGSNDGAGSNEHGWICRGGRMLNEETYENFWDLFRSIPSLEHPSKSVTDEILEFDHAHPTHARARLVDRDGKILDVSSMGFDNHDRAALIKLSFASEKELENKKITDWFAPHFFTTNFWYMWKTTFAFHDWSSLIELKRYMSRMIFEFPRIETLEGVTRTPYNQYDSLIVPLKSYLETEGVDWSLKCTVTDLEFAKTDAITVTAILYEQGDEKKKILLQPGDICIATNGSMTDSTTLGDYSHAPSWSPESPQAGTFWRNIVKKKGGALGNPEAFYGDPLASRWESFTVTSKDHYFLDYIEEWTKNKPGSGALVSFPESSWLLSFVVAKQPHFVGQDPNITIFWGYGFHLDALGDFVKKPMKECTGEEILDELLYHLHLDDAKKTRIKSSLVNVVPVMMPYIVSMFQPRVLADRPLPVPLGSTNLGFTSQFVEVPEDMVFTEEYSVRAARMAVYTLIGLDQPIIPVTPYHKKPKVLMTALKTMFR